MGNQIKNKNIGPFLAFTPQWFKKHQRILLWLANAPLLKLWFRWVLRIHRSSDLPMSERINEIGPNFFTYGRRVIPLDSPLFPILVPDRATRRLLNRKCQKDGTNAIVLQTTDFRTHVKFAKRLYFAFKPLWWVMHVWDFLADPLLPRLSFGFDTLTVYPDPGDPGTNTMSAGLGWTGTQTAWATGRTNSGNYKFTGSGADESILLNQCGTNSNEFSSCTRLGMTYNTGSLVGQVTAATLSVYLTGSGPLSSGGANLKINCVSFSPASNNAFATSDGTYTHFGTTRFTTADVDTNGNTNAYKDWTLNASGIAAVTVGGISKFALRFAGDIDNSQPTWGSNNNYFQNGRFADYTGTTADPKLVITYTPVTTYAKTVTAKARIKQAGIAKTVTAKARIKVSGVIKTISARAYILGIGAKTVQAKARIFQPNLSRTISAKARIKYTYDQSVTARSRIKQAGIAKTIQAKAKILAPPAGFVEMRAKEFPLSMQDARIKV